MRQGTFFKSREKLMMSIKDMVSSDKEVTFVRYRNQELWYVTDDGFEFPVPLADVGGAVFLARDKALLFMRYMRKHLQVIDEARRS
jgi:hypothetical protein